MASDLGARAPDPDFDPPAFFTLITRARALRRALAELELSSPEYGDPSSDDLLRRNRREEGVELAVALALRARTDGSGDILIPARDSLAAPLAFGATPLEVFRQAMGRASAPTGGWEGGARWTDLDRGLLAPVSPEGTMIEVASGVGLSLRMQASERIVVVLAGDGSSSGGAWHEGLNFAAVQRVPLLLVVIRSGSPTGAGGRPRHSRLVSFLDKCAGYGIEGDAADGDDLPAIHRATAERANRARSGAGVQLLEIRAPEADAFQTFRSQLRSSGEFEEPELSRIEDDADAELREALETARAEPEAFLTAGAEAQ